MEIERSSNPEERGREHEARSDEDLTMDLEENDGRGLRRALSNGPLKSIEGWVIFVTGIHEEAQEEDIYEAFADFGDVKNIHLNLDRRTGFVKGYALVEYSNKEEAETAIHNMDGKELLTKTISVDWAFKIGPHRKPRP